MRIGLGLGLFSSPSHASPIAWLDPSAGNVTQVAGVVTAAANLAPGRSSAIWTPGTDLAPTWSATAFGGRPGFVWAGDHRRRLIAPIVPTFAGAPPAASTGSTMICSVVETSLGTATSVLMATYRDTDVNSGYQQYAHTNTGNVTYFPQRFDEGGVLVDSLTYATAAASAAVVSFVFDPVRGQILRRNGAQVAAQIPAVATGAMLAQDFIVVGGESDAEDVAFGTSILKGTVGSALFFDSMLSAADLLYWERVLGAGAGLSF